jgi:hypothetical protein
MDRRWLIQKTNLMELGVRYSVQRSVKCNWSLFIDQNDLFDGIDRCRLNTFVNLFGHSDEFSVKEWKSNLRRLRLTDKSRHYSLRFASLRFTPLHFIWVFPSGRRRSVIPTRSLQLLVGTFFLIRRVFPEADLRLPLTSHFLFATTLKKCPKCR